MYKVLKINNEDYKLEYSVEASLYGDCVSKLMGIMVDTEMAGSEDDLKRMFSGFSNIPDVALTMFYAGLLEHHGTEVGDGKVSDLKSAKRLIAQYIKEHKEDETGNFYGVMGICMEQMSVDGFFTLVGLDAIMKGSANQEEEEQPKQKKPVKTPQDHKKATVK